MATEGANVYTAWREQVAPDAQELRFRVSNNHGASFGDGPGGRTILSVGLPHRLFNVRIAAAGSIVLVLFSTGDDETHAQFWVLRSTDGGASFAPTPFDASSPDAAHQGDLAINAAGEAHIVMENVALGEIHHRRSTDGGATFFPATNISGTADVSGNPRVSVNGSHVAVVWEERGPDGTSPADVAFAYSGDAGASFAPALNLSASAAPSEAPDVAFLDVIHVAWVEDGSVHYRRSADGSTFTGAVALGVPSAGDAAATAPWKNHGRGEVRRRQEIAASNIGGGACSTSESSALQFVRLSSLDRVAFHTITHGTASTTTSGAQAGRSPERTTGP